MIVVYLVDYVIVINYNMILLCSNLELCHAKNTWKLLNGLRMTMRKSYLV